jgi:hypothetical protein
MGTTSSDTRLCSKSNSTAWAHVFGEHALCPGGSAAVCCEMTMLCVVRNAIHMCTTPAACCSGPEFMNRCAAAAAVAGGCHGEVEVRAELLQLTLKMSCPALASSRRCRTACTTAACCSSPSPLRSSASRSSSCSSQACVCVCVKRKRANQDWSAAAVVCVSAALSAHHHAGGSRP